MQQSSLSHSQFRRMDRNNAYHFNSLISCDGTPQEQLAKNVIEKYYFNLCPAIPCCYPIKPHMGNSDVRLATFGKRWPQEKLHASPAQIAASESFSM